MSVDLWTNKQMQDKPPLEQAKTAIVHTLRRISEDLDAGYRMGMGSQTFSLLTEAAATLFNEPVEKVRRAFAPEKVRDADAAFSALEEIVRGSKCTDPGYCSPTCNYCVARRGLGSEAA